MDIKHFIYPVYCTLVADSGIIHVTLVLRHIKYQSCGVMEVPFGNHKWGVEGRRRKRGGQGLGPVTRTNSSGCAPSVLLLSARLHLLTAPSARNSARVDSLMRLVPP